MPEESQRVPDPIDRRLQEIEDHRNLELSLSNMQQRMGNNGSHTPTDVDPGDAAKAKRAADTNPFLAAPLQFGEKEVSTVVIPPKLLSEISGQVDEDGLNHHDMDMATFGKPIEEIKSKESEIVEEGSKSGILQRESKVKFKIKSSKKPTASAVTLFGDDAFVENTAVVSDNVKDGKKRRAEQILEESIEMTHEMA
jgi:transcription initiation factor TFIID subunit 8